MWELHWWVIVLFPRWSSLMLYNSDGVGHGRVRSRFCDSLKPMQFGGVWKQCKNKKTKITYSVHLGRSPGELGALYLQHYWLHSKRTLMPCYTFAWTASSAPSANSSTNFLWGNQSPINLCSCGSNKIDPTISNQSNLFLDHSDSFANGHVTHQSELMRIILRTFPKNIRKKIYFSTWPGAH